jgi:hypothetical protein
MILCGTRRSNSPTEQLTKENTMRRLLAVATVAMMMLLGVVTVGGPAQASAPVNETITLVQEFEGGPLAGWSSSGAFTDAGSWTEDSFVGSFPSPMTAAFHVETTEVGSAGAFHMILDFSFTFPSGQRVLRAATWHITKTGSGAYASLIGHGTCSVGSAPDGTFHITCPGQVRFG